MEAKVLAGRAWVARLAARVWVECEKRPRCRAAILQTTAWVRDIWTPLVGLFSDRDRQAVAGGAGGAISRPGSAGSNPDDLMAEISRSTLGRAFLVSLVVHLVLIGGTSWRFMWRRSASDGGDQRSREAAAKPAEAAEVAEAVPGAAAGGPDSTEPSAGNGAEPGKAAPKSAIEKTVEAVSTELPTQADVSFKDIDELH